MVILHPNKLTVPINYHNHLKLGWLGLLSLAFWKFFQIFSLQEGQKIALNVSFWLLAFFLFF